MSVIDWLLDSDPSIRWQVMRDLTDAPAEDVAAERAPFARRTLRRRSWAYIHSAWSLSPIQKGAWSCDLIHETLSRCNSFETFSL
jgi:hypothetical protein